MKSIFLSNYIHIFNNSLEDLNDLILKQKGH